MLPTQASLLRLHHGLADPAVLNMAYALHLEGPLSAAALEAALAAMIERHEVLRTAFTLEGERVLDVSEASFSVERIDLSSSSALRAPALPVEAHIAEISAQEASTPFDLSRPPLVRARLAVLGEDEHVLFLTFHHITADGWSLEIFGRELSRLYRAAPPLKPLRGRSADLAIEMAEWADGDPAEAQRRWWRQQLAGIDAAVIAPWGSRPAAAGTAMARRVVALPTSLGPFLEEGRKQGATLFMGMLAVIAAVLSRWTGRGEAMVGTLIANRHTAEATRWMGAHYGAAAFRLWAAEEDTLGAVLARAVEETVQVTARRLSFAEVSSLLGEAAGKDGPLMPTCLLVADRYPLYRIDLEGLRVTPLSLPTALTLDGGAAWETISTVAAADLVFFLREGGPAPALTVFWDPARVEDADRLVSAVLAAIDLFAEDLEARVFDLPSPEEMGAFAALDAAVEPARGPRCCRPMTDTFLVDALSPLPV